MLGPAARVIPARLAGHCGPGVGHHGAPRPLQRVKRHAQLASVGTMHASIVLSGCLEGESLDCETRRCLCQSPPAPAVRARITLKTVYLRHLKWLMEFFML